MPRCVICKDLFPPNYLEVIENTQPVNGEMPKKCIFCKLEINEVEREESRGSKKYVKYSKKQCVKDYEIFLKKLKDTRNVREILKKTGLSD